MKSYIEIYGPPVLKAIKALEKIAIDMPEVCIWDTVIESTIPASDYYDAATEEAYFVANVMVEIPKERCGKIISKSGEKVGEYDFYFEWFKNPKKGELNKLIEKVDTALEPLGCKYRIITK
ncbi:MAG: hypothetical protein QG670_381 [Thermoproteota archaeon]|nr:hypothetical protein [Thermoproteota archaeon]